MVLKNALAAAGLLAVALSFSAAASTLQPIAVGQGEKLFTTEFKRDENVNNNGQSGHDIFLRNAEETNGRSSNLDWGASGTTYDWTLNYKGDIASLTFGGISRTLDVDPDGNWNGVQFFVSARDVGPTSRFLFATTTVLVNSINGMTVNQSLSASGGTNEVAFWLGGDTITSLSGQLTFDFAANQGATGSPNSRLALSVKALDIAPVPVPAALPLLLAGLGGFAVLRRRKRSA